MEGILTHSLFFFFQAEGGIRDYKVTGVKTCALPICTERVRQREQAEPAQAVVPREQESRVVAVGQPARADRADEVEDADRGEQRGRRDLAEAVVHRRRNQMRADEAVRRGAAD